MTVNELQTVLDAIIQEGGGESAVYIADGEHVYTTPPPVVDAGPDGMVTFDLTDTRVRIAG